MAGWSQIIIIGNVGRDPELRYTKDGIPVLSFSIAENRRRGSGENRQEITAWYRISLWRQQAESLANIIQKGTQLQVVGQLAPEPQIYTNKAGEPATQYEVTGFNVTLLGSRGDGQGQGQGNSGGGYEEYAGSGAAADNISDIPF